MCYPFFQRSALRSLELKMADSVLQSSTLAQEHDYVSCWVEHVYDEVMYR
jgi:hypothetical protein